MFGSSGGLQSRSRLMQHPVTVWRYTDLQKIVMLANFILIFTQLDSTLSGQHRYVPVKKSHCSLVDWAVMCSAEEWMAKYMQLRFCACQGPDCMDIQCKKLLMAHSRVFAYRELHPIQHYLAKLWSLSKHCLCHCTAWLVPDKVLYASGALTSKPHPWPRWCSAHFVWADWQQNKRISFNTNLIQHSTSCTSSVTTPVLYVPFKTCFIQHQPIVVLTCLIYFTVTSWVKEDEVICTSTSG